MKPIHRYFIWPVVVVVLAASLLLYHRSPQQPAPQPAASGAESRSIVVSSAPASPSPSPSPVDRFASVTITDAQMEAVIKKTLDGINSFGYDNKNKGIYINWRRDTPTKVQCESNLQCDEAGAPTRHDKQNDIRALQHLYWYKSRHPGDSSQDEAIARILPTVKKDWGTSKLSKGWLYYVLLRLYDYTDNTADKDFWSKTITNWAQAQYDSIIKAGGFPHGKTASCDCGKSTIYLGDAYRVDQRVEVGAALVDAGTRLGRPEWVKTGYDEVMGAYKQTFSEAYGFFGRIYVYHDAKYGDNRLWDTQAKLGEISEEVDALVRAGAVTSDPKIKADFFAISTRMLNGLRDQPIHDTTYGGYYFAEYVGDYYDGKTKAGTVEKGSKEMRQASLLGTFHLANQLISPQGQWAGLEQEMKVLLVHTAQDNPPGMFLPDTGQFSGKTNGYPESTAGYSYHTNSNWTVYKQENWVSNESNSLALLGLQQVLTKPLDSGLGMTGDKR